MKKDLHPNNYRLVAFQDLTKLKPISERNQKTIKIEGVEYPLVKVHISSSSHPFYTGEERIMDIEGRVDKFKARAAAGAAARAMKVEKTAKTKPAAKAKKPAKTN